MSAPAPTADPRAIPPVMYNTCFVLFVISATYFPVAYLTRWWIFDRHGIGFPTDFVNVWAAGKLVLDGTPALAYDWDIQKKIEVAVLGQDFAGYFAWHYPPPFLFVASFLALFPYTVAYIGWMAISLVPYLAVVRAIVGRPFGLMLAVSLPMAFSNTLVGQNGFLTAALIGGALYLMPMRPVLAGVCLGLLSYKPQYGILFPIVLIAAGQWRMFMSAGVTTIALGFVAWLAFGTESWQAFVHWMPTFSQAFLSEGKATWWKLQSIYSMMRYLGTPEQFAWAVHWVFSAAVTTVVVLMWRSRVPYTLKAAALATATLLITPYLFMYDMVVLAIPVAFLVRLGLKSGFRPYELPGLGVALALTFSFILFGFPIGPAVSLVVAALILRRAGRWWQDEPVAGLAAARA